jgi:hypothetical protein
LNNIRTYFSSLGLLFNAPQNQVRIIAGSEEGLSGWISTNMLMGQLFENHQPLETYGALDMGGMSQIFSSLKLVICFYLSRGKYANQFYRTRCY